MPHRSAEGVGVAGDYVVIAVYIAGMVGIGWAGWRLARSESEFVVAGRRLGWVMYAGTMSAVVLGGASTIGGVGLGYAHGVSGAWLVVMIGLGILALHAVFARRLVRLRVCTVGEVLDLRFGGSTSVVSGVVMWVYTLMLAVTSMLAFASVFEVLLGVPDQVGVAVGGLVVVLYSVLGGMWSITVTDVVQFGVKTVGIVLVLLPVSVAAAGGFGGLRARLGAEFFDPVGVGGSTIVTYALVYGFGLLIGQDIWQRVFTARSPGVATAGGVVSGLYCLVYGVAGALIGMSARALFPGLADPDEAFATVVRELLPVGVRGLVLAAALSALMSTASGALIACSTVAVEDVVPWLVRRPLPGVVAHRWATLVLGVVAVVVAMLVGDVVGALSVAYNVLVGGLLVAVLGGLVWPRATRAGAVASMGSGSVSVVVAMLVWGWDANAPIYWGVGVGSVVFVVVSVVTPRTPEVVLGAWRARLRGAGEVSSPASSS